MASSCAVNVSTFATASAAMASKSGAEALPVFANAQTRLDRFCAEHDSTLETASRATALNSSGAHCPSLAAPQTALARWRPSQYFGLSRTDVVARPSSASYLSAPSCNAPSSTASSCVTSASACGAVRREPSLCSAVARLTLLNEPAFVRKNMSSASAVVQARMCLLFSATGEDAGWCVCTRARMAFASPGCFPLMSWTAASQSDASTRVMKANPLAKPVASSTA
mmetsp:Transcript_17388/g.58734  ORF Transcript_17388/g.58734 Transcript_17388/m.58734 type:complete len:225 (-) Transcript_17388:202-876(-)